MSLAAAAGLAAVSASHDEAARDTQETSKRYEFEHIRDLVPPTRSREVKLVRDRAGGRFVCKAFLRATLQTCSKTLPVKPGMTSKRSGKAIQAQEKEIDRIKREIAIMRRLDHSNVARVREDL